MQLIPALNHDFMKILSKPTTISGLKNKGLSKNFFKFAETKEVPKKWPYLPQMFQRKKKLKESLLVHRVKIN